MTQTLWGDIVDRAVAQVGTIENIGRVWNRERFVIGEGDYRDIAVSDVLGDGVSRLRVWMVHLGDVRADPLEAGGQVQWTRSVLFDGWLQMEDAQGSELEAVYLAEQIARVLWLDWVTTKWGGLVLIVRPPAIGGPQPVFFAQTACHSIRVTVPVVSIESPT